MNPYGWTDWEWEIINALPASWREQFNIALDQVEGLSDDEWEELIK